MYHQQFNHATGFQQQQQQQQPQQPQQVQGQFFGGGMNFNGGPSVSQQQPNTASSFYPPPHGFTMAQQPYHHLQTLQQQQLPQFSGGGGGGGYIAPPVPQTPAFANNGIQQQQLPQYANYQSNSQPPAGSTLSMQPQLPTRKYGANKNIQRIGGIQQQQQQQQQLPPPLQGGVQDLQTTVDDKSTNNVNNINQQQYISAPQEQHEVKLTGTTSADVEEIKQQSSSKAVKLEQLLQEKKLLIKPFTPAHIFKHHCYLRLGSQFYRSNPKCNVINPYNADGVSNGFSDSVHTMVEWRMVKQVLMDNDELSESELQASFGSDEDEGALDPDDLCLVLNPLETIMCHSEEYIAVALGYWPVVEAVGDLGRCGIRVSLAYTPQEEQYIYRPILCITNTSRYAKAVLVAGRPVASLALLQPPQQDFAVPSGDSFIHHPAPETNEANNNNPNSSSSNTTSVSEQQLKAFSTLWQPTALLNP